MLSRMLFGFLFVGALACKSVVLVVVCGDGFQEASEPCDDGNPEDGDGCSAQCAIEFCGDGIVNNAPNEACDDANQIPLDGCESDCTVTPPLDTFLDDGFAYPNQDEVPLFGQDQDGDGDVDDIDNSARDFRLAMISGGVAVEIRLSQAVSNGDLLIAQDVAAQNLINDPNAKIFGSIVETVDSEATPLFNGSDQIVTVDGQTFTLESNGLSNGSFRASIDEFFYPMVIAREPFFLPMKSAVLTGTIDEASGTITDGTFSGVIEARDFAARVELFAENYNLFSLIAAEIFALTEGELFPIPCEGNNGIDLGSCGLNFCSDRVEDGNETGFCHDRLDPFIVAFALLDEDKDGIFEVEFNEETETFSRNELAPLFDMEPGQAPTGLVGNLFRLDRDQDGVSDAMGMGIGFSAVTAVRP